MSPLCLVQKKAEPLSPRAAEALGVYLETYDLLCATGPTTLCHPHYIQAIDRLAGALAPPFTHAEVAALVSREEVLQRREGMWKAVRAVQATTERYHAARGLDRALAAYPWYEKYDLLVDAELEQIPEPMVRALNASGQSLALVGAGALPLSAILYHQKTGFRVTCVEDNEFTAALATRFLKQNGISSNAVNVVHTNSVMYDYELHPLIILTTLCARKKAILQHMKDGDTLQHVGIRSGVGAFGLIYEPLQMQMGNDLYIYFDRRTVADARTIETTHFSAHPVEDIIFEKEEPKPDRGDIWYYPPLAHHAHG